jgi:hypothetical protein
MVLMFIWGSRCLGEEGGSLRECPHLKIEIWGTSDLWRPEMGTRICGLDREKTARFYIFADEGDGGFERRSRSEDG